MSTIGIVGASDGSGDDTEPTGPRIVIADDAVLMRTMLGQLLSDAGMILVGEAADLDSALAVVADTRPDVVILDIRMPPSWTDEGIRAAKAIRATDPSIGILILSSHVETATAADLIESCGDGIGYLLKDRLRRVDDLTETITRLRAGEVVVDPEIVRLLFARKRHVNPLDLLTPTQREVLALVAEGLSNRGIADRLCVGDRTVETHVSAVFEALGLERTPLVHRRVLAAMALLRGAD